MAGLKVFISSTCYDLSILRSDLRSFVLTLGYEPIMSDYADVLYDPRQHTHSSCIEEVKNCDMLVVIIGSRYGGRSVPAALEKIDMQSMEDVLQYVKDNKLQPSITQLEVLEALQCNIPIYTFIDKKVYYEHEVYEKNKDVSSTIIYPAIEKQDTAKYIFEFINFLRLRSTGNSIFQFEKMQDIEEILKKQWSGYFQRLLNEQRHLSGEQKKVDILAEQFKDLKAALLSSIEDVDQRSTVKGIVTYRRMIELLMSIGVTRRTLISSDESISKLLENQNIVDVIDSRRIFPDRAMVSRTIFLKKDETFFDCRMRFEMVEDVFRDWDSFKKESSKIREIVFDAVAEMYSPRMSECRYRTEPFNKYLSRNYERATYTGTNVE